MSEKAVSQSLGRLRRDWKLVDRLSVDEQSYKLTLLAKYGPDRTDYDTGTEVKRTETLRDNTVRNTAVWIIRYGELMIHWHASTRKLRCPSSFVILNFTESIRLKKTLIRPFTILLRVQPRITRDASDMLRSFPSPSRKLFELAANCILTK